MEKISIIIPVYFNKESLKPLYDDMKEKVLTKLECEYEIVMVDDGSTDGSYDEICRLSKIDDKIIPVKLSRNFGQHAAILAGLSKCTGTCATMKAADLQEPSEMILDMLNKYKETSCKVVLGIRQERDESFSRVFFGDLYSAIMKKFILKNMPKGGFDCFLIDRQVIDVLNMMEEKNTSLMGQILWSGFKTEKVYYKRQRREIGKSKWTLSKKVKLFFDSIFGFSYLPINLISVAGAIFFLCAMIGLIYVLIAKVVGHIDVEGYTTIIIVLLLGFGVTMLSLGVIGGYIWRLFDAVRKRPPFIIDESPDKITKKNGHE
ncbi:MAG: glycosyltransferase family 2 protein [Clostridia bacterium]|nr:glycosyltransferase family 2 protein [Clostridia bacterium]